MPLILLSGYPSSGKTHRAHQLTAYLTTKIRASSDPRVQRLTVSHIDDQTLGLSRDVYRDARAEKDARAAVYSAVKRALGRDCVVILDGMNYIKGWRYQVYCEAKAVETGSCVVHVGTPVDTCRELNRKRLLVEDDDEDSKDRGYPEDVFENLVYRYEEPNGMTRWDSPLFTVLYDDPTPPLDEIWEAVVGSEGKGKVVRPNQATVLKPPTPSNYLYELDKTTQDVLATISQWQKDHPGEYGGEISFPDAGASLLLPASPISLPQLQRLRRQFIALNRQHNLPQVRVRSSFVEYLGNNF